MYVRYKKGEFGNKPISWDAWSDLQASGFSGKVGIRVKRASGHFEPYVPVGKVQEVVRNVFYPRGYKDRDFEFSEMQDDENILRQGYFMIRDGRPVFYFSEKPTHIRKALAEDGEEIYGYYAILLARDGMCPDSLENFERLLTYETGSIHESPVIEFSTYKQPVGLLGWRTIFWEVRAY